MKHQQADRKDSPQTVRGSELTKKMEQSQAYGEDYRKSHQGQDIQAPVKPSKAEPVK